MSQGGLGSLAGYAMSDSDEEREDMHKLTGNMYAPQNSISYQNILSRISRNGDCVRMLISDRSISEVQAPPIPPSLAPHFLHLLGFRDYSLTLPIIVQQ